MNNKGFTLIELMVSLAIFAAVVGISVNLFTASFRTQRKAQRLQDVLDNARFSLERMAKAIRVSCIKTPDTGPNNSTSTLDVYHFRRAKHLQYRLANGRIKEIENPGGADEIESDLTGERIQVDKLGFFVQGVGPADDRQPQATIVLNFEPNIEKWEGGAIRIQTTVSPRFLEKFWPSPECDTL